MSTEPQEELLSAYLDDELSPDERAQVERWLAESADYRQLYYELRAVRHDLASLPRHKLAEDLGAAILRRAERAVLVGRQPPRTADVTPRTGLERWWSQGRSRRMLVWPAVAIAAALLIAVFETRRDAGERQVAQQPADEMLRRDHALPEAAPGEVADAKAAPALSDSVGPSLDARGDLRGAAGAAPDAELHRKEAAPPDALMLKLPAAAARAAEASTVDRPGQEWKMETNLRRALGLREQVNLIQCDVSPDFIKENQIEKVFAGNKVEFTRLDVLRAADEKDLAAKSQVQLPQDVGLRYSVQATPAQVEQIVTELQQDQGRVSNLALGLQNAVGGQVGARAKRREQQESLKPNMAGGAADSATPKSGKLTQQPVVIWLRPTADGKPQQPAKP